MSDTRASVGTLVSDCRMLAADACALMTRVQEAIYPQGAVCDESPKPPLGLGDQLSLTRDNLRWVCHALSSLAADLTSGEVAPPGPDNRVVSGSGPGGGLSGASMPRPIGR